MNVVPGLQQEHTRTVNKSRLDIHSRYTTEYGDAYHRNRHSCRDTNVRLVREPGHPRLNVSASAEIALNAGEMNNESEASLAQ